MKLILNKYIIGHFQIIFFSCLPQSEIGLMVVKIERNKVREIETETQRENNDRDKQR